MSSNKAKRQVYRPKTGTNPNSNIVPVNSNANVDNTRTNNNNSSSNNNNNNNNNNSNNIIQDDNPRPNNRRRNAANGAARREARLLDELEEVVSGVRSTDNVGAYRRKDHPEDEPFYMARNRVNQGPGQKESESLAIIQRDLDKLKARSNRIPPVAKIGAGISTGALAAVHMFCDPARSAAVPLPGRQPSSQVKCTSLAATSIPLYQGEAGVIVTPMGKQQYWLTKGYFVGASYPLVETLDPYVNPINQAQVNGFLYPRILFKGNSNQLTQCTLIQNKGFTPGLTAKASVQSLPSGQRPEFYHKFTVQTTALAPLVQGGAGILLKMPHQAGRLSVFHAIYDVTNGVQVNNWTTVLRDVDGGTNAIITGSQALADQDEYAALEQVILPQPPAATTYEYSVAVTYVPTDAAIHHLYSIDISAIQTANLPGDRQDGVPGYLAPVFTNDLTTWDGYTMPAVINLEQGKYTEQGQFIALSGLLTNDSSSLNNGGMLMQLSTYTDAFGPQTSVKKYIASTNSKQYIGALRYGGYQIYVPTNLQLLTFDDWASNPFISAPGQEQYNMLYWIDYSASPLQGQAIPSIVACHLKVDGVFSTTSLSAFVDPNLIPADYSIYTALGLLRHAYTPCENPDHMDQIKSWLTSAIKGTINYGKTMITEFQPELTEIAGKAVRTLVPLAIGAACAL